MVLPSCERALSRSFTTSEEVTSNPVSGSSSNSTGGLKQSGGKQHFLAHTLGKGRETAETLLDYVECLQQCHNLLPQRLLLDFPKAPNQFQVFLGSEALDS